MAKIKSLKIRFEEGEYKKLEKQAKARGVPMGAIVRELINALPADPPVKPIAKIIYGEWYQNFDSQRSLPDQPPQIPQPPVKL